MKIKISVKDLESTVIPNLQASGLKDAALETFVNNTIKTQYEVTDDAGSAVEFVFKVKALAPAQTPIDMTAITTEIKSAVADAIKLSANQRPHIEVIGNDAEWRIPKGVKMYGGLANFKGVKNGRHPQQRAYEFGMWCLGAMGYDSGVKFSKSKGYDYIADAGAAENIKVQRENNNTSSAFLVPDPLENDIIDLREQFGVFRQLAKIVPMSSDTRSDPRRKGGLTVYVVGESVAPTASDKTWDRVRLTAKKIGVLTKYTRELGEDAIINIGDDLAGEIAYAFTGFEDDCGFNGDGTSAYAGITGARAALLAVAGTANTVTMTSNTWDTATLANHDKLIGLLPQYAYTGGDVGWMCSQQYWGQVMQRLAGAAGGNTAINVVDGVPQYRFRGWPVTISQKMPTASASTTISAIFGSLRKAARFGERRATSIRMSDVALNAFEQDEIAMVGFERFDINVHDVGSTTTAGPIVAITT